MSYDHTIYVKMRADLHADLQTHHKKEEEKHDEEYPFSRHVRSLLRAAIGRKPKPVKAPATIDLTAKQIAQRIAGIWDEEMPQHISRIGQRSDKRRQSLMARWSENNDFECWRLAFRALSKDMYHMNRKNFSVEYFLRPSHFAKWIDAGEALKNQEGAANDFLDILTRDDNEE